MFDTQRDFDLMRIKNAEFERDNAHRKCEQLKAEIEALQAMREDYARLTSDLIIARSERDECIAMLQKVYDSINEPVWKQIPVMEQLSALLHKAKEGIHE